MVISKIHIFLNDLLLKGLTYLEIDLKAKPQA
jgi:hypothetical protein